jgi:hypothetical protein
LRFALPKTFQFSGLSVRNPFFQPCRNKNIVDESDLL